MDKCGAETRYTFQAILRVCFILIVCPGVKCKHEGITFQTPFLFIVAELLPQPKETSMETFKFNLTFLGARMFSAT